MLDAGEETMMFEESNPDEGGELDSEKFWENIVSREVTDRMNCPELLSDEALKIIFNDPLTEKELASFRNELPVFGGIPIFFIRRILRVFPYTPDFSTLTPVLDRNASKLEIGEYPLVPIDLKAGEYVSFLVSVPFECRAKRPRFSGPPLMGLTAMRMVDLYNYLIELGFLNDKKLKYGVFAPEEDDDRYIQRLVDTMTYLEKNGNPILCLNVSVASLGSIYNAAQIERTIREKHPSVVIVRGGTNTGHMSSSSTALAKSGSEASFLLSGGPPEFAIWAVMDKAREIRSDKGNLVPDSMVSDHVAKGLLGNGSRSKFPYEGQVCHQERSGVRNIIKTRPEKRMPEPIDLGLNQPPNLSERHEAFRNPETGVPVPTLFLAMGGKCPHACDFCSVFRGENELRPIDEIVKDIGVFVQRIERNTESQDNPGAYFGLWIETPTATRYPSKYIRDLAAAGELEGADYFDYDMMSSLLSDHLDKPDVRLYMNFLTILEVTKRTKDKYGKRVQSGIETRPDQVIAKGKPEEIRLGREMIIAMVQRGINYISFSGETGNRGLKLLNKGYKFEQYVALIDLLVSMSEEVVPDSYDQKGDSVRLRDILLLGNSFMAGIIDINATRQMQRKGVTPKDALKELKEKGEKEKVKFYEGLNLEKERKESYLKNESPLFVDTLYDFEQILKQLKKMIDAGYLVSYGANVLTPFAPDNIEDFSTNYLTDPNRTGFWGAYLWLKEIDPSESFISSPFIASFWAEYFESRGDHGFFELLDKEEKERWFNALIDIISKVFPERAVARRDLQVRSDDGKKVAIRTILYMPDGTTQRYDYMDMEYRHLLELRRKSKIDTQEFNRRMLSLLKGYEEDDCDSSGLPESSDFLDAVQPAEEGDELSDGDGKKKIVMMGIGSKGLKRVVQKLL